LGKFQFSGFFPAEYSEADRVPVLARWQMSGHPSQPQPLSVLPFQKMFSRRHVPRL